MGAAKPAPVSLANLEAEARAKAAPVPQAGHAAAYMGCGWCAASASSSLVGAAKPAPVSLASEAEARAQAAPVPQAGHAAAYMGCGSEILPAKAGTLERNAACLAA